MTTSIYQEHPPAAALQSWVAYYWMYRASSVSDRLSHPIPPEAGITITLLPNVAASTVLTGPHRQSIDVPVTAGTVTCGVRFWPGLGRALTNVPTSELVDRMVPTQSVAPHLDQALAPLRALVDSRHSPDLASLATAFDLSLAPIAPRPDQLDQTVLEAVFQLLHPDDALTATQLAHRAGLSPRQFRRRFKDAVGMSTTDLRRVRRIRTTLADAVLHSNAAWIDLAANHGYADQAHLCREFQKVVFRSPNHYKSEIHHIEHRTLVDR